MTGRSSLVGRIMRSPSRTSDGSYCRGSLAAPRGVLTPVETACKYCQHREESTLDVRQICQKSVRANITRTEGSARAELRKVLEFCSENKTRSAEVFWQSECELLKSTEVRQTINYAMQHCASVATCSKVAPKPPRLLYKVLSRDHRCFLTSRAVTLNLGPPVTPASFFPLH